MPKKTITPEQAASDIIKKEALKDKIVYRVKLKPEHSAHKSQVYNGYLGDRDARTIMEYDEIRVARSKARMFGGRAEPFVKKAKKVTFKVWTVVEQRVEFEDGSETYTDIKDDTQSAGEFKEYAEAVKQMDEINSTFGGDFTEE